MIGHKLPNKTKSATVAEPKLFHQLNNPIVIVVHQFMERVKENESFVGC
jgi:hypothetical protein